MPMPTSHFSVRAPTHHSHSTCSLWVFIKTCAPGRSQTVGEKFTQLVSRSNHAIVFLSFLYQLLEWNNLSKLKRELCARGRRRNLHSSHVLVIILLNNFFPLRLLGFFCVSRIFSPSQSRRAPELMNVFPFECVGTELHLTGCEREWIGRAL